jgi:ribonuclease R
MVSVELLGEEDFYFEEKMVRLVGRRTGKRFQLGDLIKVRVLTADIILRRIDLALGGEDNQPKPKRRKQASW